MESRLSAKLEFVKYAAWNFVSTVCTANRLFDISKLLGSVCLERPATNAIGSVLQEDKEIKEMHHLEIARKAREILTDVAAGDKESNTLPGKLVRLNTNNEKLCDKALLFAGRILIATAPFVDFVKNF